MEQEIKIAKENWLVTAVMQLDDNYTYVPQDLELKRQEKEKQQVSVAFKNSNEI